MKWGNEKFSVDEKFMQGSGEEKLRWQPGKEAQGGTSFWSTHDCYWSISDIVLCFHSSEGITCKNIAETYIFRFLFKVSFIPGQSIISKVSIGKPSSYEM